MPLSSKLLFACLSGSLVLDLAASTRVAHRVVELESSEKAEDRENSTGNVLCMVIENPSTVEFGMKFGFVTSSCGMASCNVFKFVSHHLPNFIKAHTDKSGRCHCLLAGSSSRPDKPLFKVMQSDFQCESNNCWQRYARILQSGKRKHGHHLRSPDMLTSQNHWQVATDECGPGDESYVMAPGLSEIVVGLDEEEAEEILNEAGVDADDDTDDEESQEEESEFADCPEKLVLDEKDEDSDYCFDDETDEEAPQYCCTELHWCKQSIAQTKTAVYQRMAVIRAKCDLGQPNSDAPDAMPSKEELCTPECQSLVPWVEPTELKGRRCKGKDGVGYAVAEELKTLEQELKVLQDVEDVRNAC